MIYTGENHTFVVCAYGQSPYLQECLDSLKNQTVHSKIIMVTSTPNEQVEKCALRYQIPLYINTGEKGIAGDWNFGYSKANTEIVTIAHQDDIYEPLYAEKIIKAASGRKKPLILFTDYGELRDGTKVQKNTLLQIKRIMIFPLRIKKLQKIRWVRRRILSLGSAISCPTVSYVKPNLPTKIFESGYRSDLDWQAWEKLSKIKGEFIYCSDICMYHRIHEESETTNIISDHGRSKEDFEMFCKFWPKPIAKLIAKFYRLGEKSNKL